eukprot:tig00000057_g33.t1
MGGVIPSGEGQVLHQYLAENHCKALGAKSYVDYVSNNCYELPQPAVLPKLGDKFTIQENASGKCLYFDETQKDAWGDWALKAATCDPKAANLEAKFLWTYNDLTGADGDNLESQGWHGIGNSNRIPDLPNFCSSNCGGMWPSGHLIRGWHTQTNDPDGRVK